MKKVFEKKEGFFSILLIFVYVIYNSLLVQQFGINHHMTSIGLFILSALIIGLIIVLDRVKFYGLKKAENVKEHLYFMPLIIFGTSALWGGINKNVNLYEIIFHILTMINVGFLEEIVFRGFLFKMMAKDNIKTAIIVTSLTFGIGHIVNLLNGAALVPTLFQIGYAVSLGYLFVIVLVKSKSLIPCILTHMSINGLSIFLVDNFISNYITPTLLIILPLCYALYIQRTVKE